MRHRVRHPTRCAFSLHEMTRYLVVWKIIWIASGAAALAAREPLDPSEPDPSWILQLVEETEEAWASGALLHEAHVLLKYNLEYLAEPENWTSEE